MGPTTSSTLRSETRSIRSWPSLMARVSTRQSKRSERARLSNSVSQSRSRAGRSRMWATMERATVSIFPARIGASAWPRKISSLDCAPVVGSAWGASSAKARTIGFICVSRSTAGPVRSHPRFSRSAPQTIVSRILGFCSWVGRPVDPLSFSRRGYSADRDSKSRLFSAEEPTLSRRNTTNPTAIQLQSTRDSGTTSKNSWRGVYRTAR